MYTEYRHFSVYIPEKDLVIAEKHTQVLIADQIQILIVGSKSFLQITIKFQITHR